jgi:hypothetical protein
MIMLLSTRSLILFMTSVMLFVWRVGLNQGSVPAVTGRIGQVGVTVLFMVGITYLILVLITLKTYGRKMDAKWQDRVKQWTRKHRMNHMFSPLPSPGGRASSPSPSNRFRQFSQGSTAAPFSPVYLPTPWERDPALSLPIDLQAHQSQISPPISPPVTYPQRSWTPPPIIGPDLYPQGSWNPLGPLPNIPSAAYPHQSWTPPLINSQAAYLRPPPINSSFVYPQKSWTPPINSSVYIPTE